MASTDLNTKLVDDSSAGEALDFTHSCGDLNEVESLRRQLHEIAQMAGALVHEIRNPLSTMILNLDLIREDIGASSDPKDRRIAKKVDRVRQESLVAGPSGSLFRDRQARADSA